MTLDPFWVPFVIKIAVTMVVVVAAARVAERAGPFFGALIACLPVSAGPSFVLLSLQASDGFVADTALSSACSYAPPACDVSPPPAVVSTSRSMFSTN